MKQIKNLDEALSFLYRVMRAMQEDIGEPKEINIQITTNKIKIDIPGKELNTSSENNFTILQFEDSFTSLVDTLANDMFDHAIKTK